VFKLICSPAATSDIIWPFGASRYRLNNLHVDNEIMTKENGNKKDEHLPEKVFIDIVWMSAH
jgi:hypothetical protein